MSYADMASLAASVAAYAAAFGCLVHGLRKGRK